MQAEVYGDREHPPDDRELQEAEPALFVRVGLQQLVLDALVHAMVEPHFFDSCVHENCYRYLGSGGSVSSCSLQVYFFNIIIIIIIF